MEVGHLPHPVGNSRGEETNLQILLALPFHVAQDLLNIFFKSKLQHLVSLVKNHSADLRKVDISTVQVVEHAARRAHKNFTTRFQVLGLVLNIDAAIDGSTRVL